MNTERWQELDRTLKAMSPEQKAYWYDGLTDREQWEVAMAYANHAPSVGLAVRWWSAYFVRHPVALWAMRIAAFVVLAAVVLGVYIVLT